MAFRLRAFRDEDLDDGVAVFNHYIEHTFAAYGSKPMSRATLAAMVEACGRLPTVVARTEDGGTFAGFGFLRPYSPLDSFSRTAVITTFLAPTFTRRGLGSLILSHLEAKAVRVGICEILAHISSKNPASIGFHRKAGFEDVGCFRRIGLKRETAFDVVWMQKTLQDAPGEGSC